MSTAATKGQRRRLRDLARLAYERELARALDKLDGDFRRWRSGEIDPHELSDRIHRFHEGTSRSLYSRYEGSDLDMIVAQAIVRKVISDEEAGPEILQLLGRILDFARSQ
jgi:hypothetical protein